MALEKTFDTGTAEARIYAAWEQAGCFKAGANDNEMIKQAKNLLDSNFTSSLNAKEYLEKLAGNLDGNASKRIVTFLLENC